MPIPRLLTEGADPENWPQSKVERDALWDKFDQTARSDILNGLRQLSSAEDGFISLKPMLAVRINIVWKVSPVYFVPKWPHQGPTLLNRWITSISQLDVSREAKNRPNTD